MTRYTVLGIEPNPRSYEANGPKLAYKVRFAEHADVDVEWSQKAETPPPRSGQSVDGSIDWSGKFGPKFKREFQNPGGGGAQATWSERGSTWKPRDPAETAAIQRQHSQGVAARIAIAAGWFKEGWNPHGKDDASVLNDLARLTDWMQRDITRGVKLAEQDNTTVASYGKQKGPEQTGQSDVPSDAPAHPAASEEGAPWAA